MPPPPKHGRVSASGRYRLYPGATACTRIWRSSPCMVAPLHPIPFPMNIKKKNPSNVLEIYAAKNNGSLPLPYVEQGISAGFPSPALDFVDLSIDLNQHLIKHPSSTFYGRVKGDSLKNAGIGHGDLLVIDKSLEPANGKIAVCYIDGEFTAKRIKKQNGEVWLLPENDAYKPIKIEPENDFLVWGIVTHVIKTV
jgi:DNA polymerase V